MATWDDLDWKQCENLFPHADEIPHKTGAYVVRCAPNGSPRSVCRVFATDLSGILCFGRTTGQGGLRGRLSKFWRATTGGKEVAHAEGRRYCELNYNTRGFPRSALEIAWVTLERPDAVRKELAWFDEYVGDFGELPPLNRKRG
jgi:hypothetical protein